MQIFRIDNPGPSTSTVVTVSHDPLLASACFPFVGANGIALNHEGSALFIANTGDDSVLKLDLDTNEVTVFAESINGADGLAFDRKGRLWVAANQNDELVALSRDGRVVARVGDFGGLDCDGSHRGLLLPASMVIVEDEMYVTNLALTPTETHAIEEDVRLYTISCISLPWE